MSKKSNQVLLVALALGLPTPAPTQAQVARDAAGKEKSYIDEIVVTATRNPQSLRTVGSAVDVLTADDIQARPRLYLSDLLRAIPGLAVNQTGPLGNLTQVRMRGAEGNHTLVLIDGMEVGDPFNNSEFDFSTVLADTVSRVEVLRGGQSSLYGSEAIGGVINITTVDADARQLISGQAGAGSFGTWNGSLRAAFRGARGAGHAQVSGLKSRGISQSKVGPERDGHRNVSVLGGGQFPLSEQASITVNARFVDTRAELDTQDFAFGSPTQGLVIDSNDVRKARTISAKGLGTLRSRDDQWTTSLSWAFTDTRNRNLVGTTFGSGSSGRKHDIEWMSTLTWGEETAVVQSVTGLLEYEGETFANRSAAAGPQNQRRTTDSYAGAAEYRLAFGERVFVTGALRRDGYERFQDATTFRLTGAWQVSDTTLKMRASVGTGIAKPSFFELFGFNPTTFVGNPGLVPEKSNGWDAGADLTLADGRAVVSVTYFRADLDAEIFTDFSRLPFTPRNRPGESRRQGAELSARWSPADDVVVAGSYTYTDAEEDTGRREIRRPKNAASLSMTATLLDDRARAGLSLDYNGEQEDAEFIFATPGDRVTLKSYLLASVSASYEVARGIELTGRLDNLLDQDNEQVFSYASNGLGAYVGVRLRFGDS
jgi:vitamin B12 transporter